VLVLWMGEIYEVSHRDGLRWHDIRVHTKLHEDWLLGEDTHVDTQKHTNTHTYTAR
jgi:hypothetical protein